MAPAGPSYRDMLWAPPSGAPPPGPLLWGHSSFGSNFRIRGCAQSHNPGDSDDQEPVGAANGSHSADLSCLPLRVTESPAVESSPLALARPGTPGMCP